MMTAAPKGLHSGGRKLWNAVDGAHTLDEPQLVQLEEACRAKDRLDELDVILSDDLAGNSTMLKDANATANLMKQLLAALRLPDEKTGKTPQYRGARGAVAPQVPGGRVSSLDRARNRAG